MRSERQAVSSVDVPVVFFAEQRRALGQRIENRAAQAVPACGSLSVVCPQPLRDGRQVISSSRTTANAVFRSADHSPAVVNSRPVQCREPAPDYSFRIRL